jgi:hypothetical protein
MHGRVLDIEDRHADSAKSWWQGGLPHDVHETRDSLLFPTEVEYIRNEPSIKTRNIPCVCGPHRPASTFGRDGEALEVINSMTREVTRGVDDARMPERMRSRTEEGRLFELCYEK